MRAAHSPTFTVSAEIGHVVSVSSAPIRTCHTHTHTHTHTQADTETETEKETETETETETQKHTCLGPWCECV
jgi:hypothetical protein